MKISPSKFTSRLGTDETSFSPRADFFPTHWEGNLRLQVQLCPWFLGQTGAPTHGKAGKRPRKHCHGNRLQRRGKHLDQMLSYPEVKVTTVTWSMWLQHSSYTIHRRRWRHGNHQYSHSTHLQGRTTHSLCDPLYVDLFYNMLVFSYIKWK